jgi:hypothetical protein
MTPTLGRIVLLALSAADAEQINRRRTTGADISDRIKLNGWHIGAQAHIGNVAKEGTIVPSMVVAKWSGGSVNLQAFLDGNDVFWATSREEGTKPGQWSWPVIEKPVAAPTEAPAQKPARADGQTGEETKKSATKKEDVPPAK